MASYQIVQGDPTEYSVPEYPSFADEKRFHRLLVRADERIVPPDQKEQICEKWGWGEEAIREEVKGYQEYNQALVEVIFEQEVTADPDRLRPGAIQDARMDFIQGCQGRSDGQENSSLGDLMTAVASLAAQDETNGPTTPKS